MKCPTCAHPVERVAPGWFYCGRCGEGHEHPAAVLLGSLGGKAGRGKAKARTPAQCRKAALKRWSKRPTL